MVIEVAALGEGQHAQIADKGKSVPIFSTMLLKADLTVKCSTTDVAVVGINAPVAGSHMFCQAIRTRKCHVAFGACIWFDVSVRQHVSVKSVFFCKAASADITDVSLLLLFVVAFLLYL